MVVYKSEFEKGKRDWRGKQTLPSGEVYQGQWKMMKDMDSVSKLYPIVTFMKATLCSIKNGKFTLSDVTDAVIYDWI